MFEEDVENKENEIQLAKRRIGQLIDNASKRGKSSNDIGSKLLDTELREIAHYISVVNKGVESGDKRI